MTDAKKKTTVIPITSKKATDNCTICVTTKDCAPDEVCDTITHRCKKMHHQSVPLTVTKKTNKTAANESSTTTTTTKKESAPRRFMNFIKSKLSRPKKNPTAVTAAAPVSIQVLPTTTTTAAAGVKPTIAVLPVNHTGELTVKPVPTIVSPPKASLPPAVKPPRASVVRRPITIHPLASNKTRRLLAPKNPTSNALQRIQRTAALIAPPMKSTMAGIHPPHNAFVKSTRPSTVPSAVASHIPASLLPRVPPTALKTKAVVTEKHCTTTDTSSFLPYYEYVRDVMYSHSQLFWNLLLIMIVILIGIAIWYFSSSSAAVEHHKHHMSMSQSSSGATTEEPPKKGD
jgi:hypothetical protein